MTNTNFTSKIFRNPKRNSITKLDKLKSVGKDPTSSVKKNSERYGSKDFKTIFAKTTKLLLIYLNSKYAGSAFVVMV